MVPGHEIVGVVEQVGASVKQFKVGQMVGMGCFVDSAGPARNAKKAKNSTAKAASALPQREGSGMASRRPMAATPQSGGRSAPTCFASRQLRPEKPPASLRRHHDLLAVTPLGVGKGHRLAIVGLGGLGHMAVKIRKKFWALT